MEHHEAEEEVVEEGGEEEEEVELDVDKKENFFILVCQITYGIYLYFLYVCLYCHSFV